MVAMRAWGAARYTAFLLLWLLAGVLSACSSRAGDLRLDPALAPFTGDKVVQVRFAGGEPFSADTLIQLIETTPARCNFLGLSICIPFLNKESPKSHLNLAVVERDVVQLRTFYRQAGYFGARVIPVVRPAADTQNVVVTFVISPGVPVHLESLEIEGVAGILPPEIRERIPSRVDSLFDLGAFTASADTIQRELRSLGHAYAVVLRNYTVDTVTHSARARLIAVAGPTVLVDSIIVVGAPHLGRPAVLRQLTFRRGDLLLSDKLLESQRNLYDLDIVQFASVTVAPDSLQVTPLDSSTATVLVQITEAPVHVVEAAVGYGTVDCFRTETRWTSRSLAGGARRLALTGALSKIGLGDPLDFGFGNSICRAFAQDTFENKLDYRFTADLLQPWFLSPRNRLVLNAYAERVSEPRVYQVEAQGGRFTVNRRLGLYDLLTALINVEHSKTIASDALFCATFAVCLPADIDSLSQFRWLNALGTNWARDRTNSAVDPTSGYLTRAGLGWATPALGSQVTFLRGIGEGATYAPVGSRSVLALRLRVGSFFGTASLAPGHQFIPPSERFFAGGSTTVRGYSRNELGPGVYVGSGPAFTDTTTITFSPTGGTGLLVANAEIRFPAPFASDILNMVLFADAGTVTSDAPVGGSFNKVRITPGFGFRLRTPVGPLRADIGYNPYLPLTAPLFLPDTMTGGLIRVLDSFTPAAPTFLGRFRLHLAVGQPF
jgi:outer membrane protein assembly factor BamA